jgi:multidrug transporter EmrE-like cation transporter
MKISQVVMLMIFAIGMGLGQLLLKFSAQRQSINSDNHWSFRVLALFSDWPFLLGITLYSLLLVYWVWLLTFLPLSRAYPFTIVSFIIAAAGGALFFHEPLTLPLIAGLAIIGIGLIVLSTGY